MRGKSQCCVQKSLVGLASWLGAGCFSDSTAIMHPGIDAARQGSSLSAMVAAPSLNADAGVALQGAAEQRALKACDNACKVEAYCGLVDEAECDAACSPSVQVLAKHHCADEATAENECLSSLSCRELRDYTDNGRRTAAQCGAQAQAFFDHCTLGAGMVPQTCTALCMQYANCGQLKVSMGACEETCVSSATGFGWSRGSGCSSAYLNFVGCAAQASCVELDALLTNHSVPQGCRELDRLFGESCKG